MEYTTFVRTPFVVEAVQITPENIEEVAKLIGEVRQKDGQPYIALDKRVIPNINRAFVGFWLTRLGDNLRCYAPKVFAEQFTELPEDGSLEWVFEAEVEELEEVPQPEVV